MTSDGSVTGWLGLLQVGDAVAAQLLWQRYFKRLVGLARQRLQQAPRRAADEEDVALSAFDSFCRGAEAGRFPQLTDRDSLWRLLVVLTVRKASHLVRDENRQKRGGLGSLNRLVEEDSILDQVLSREPTPEMATQMAEECRRLLACLGDPELEQVALWRLEGYSVKEIAAKLDLAPRSVKRKLSVIRSHWAAAVDRDAEDSVD
jgi:DNA-directed RNA polymerase specialized sigma24 family protein